MGDTRPFIKRDGGDVLFDEGKGVPSIMFKSSNFFTAPLVFVLISKNKNKIGHLITSNDLDKKYMF